MPEASKPAPVNFAALASYLEALHYPLRLELLQQLRVPRLLADIHVSPHRAAGGSPDRTAARETIREHLEKLVEVGLVRVESVRAEGRTANRYAVNAQKLYELTEEMRRLSTVYAGRGAGGDATGTLAADTHPPPATGPRLVLVHGVYEGKAFALDPALAPEGRWVIGRRPGLAVSLDYDPYVSLDHAAVARRGASYWVEDLPESKNGTAVNWALMPKGARHDLRGGDLVGVGRSLLLFLAE